MAYSSTYNLMRLYPHPQKGRVNVRTGASTAHAVLMTLAYPSLIGTGTGNYVAEGSYRWYEIDTAYGKGWVRDDLLSHGTKASAPVALSPKLKDSDGATRVLKQITSHDFKTFHLLKQNEAMLARLKRAGKSVSAYEAKLQQIAANYQGRQQKLKDLEAAKGSEFSATRSFSESFVNAWEWLKGGFSGIGVLPALLIPVVSALIAGGSIIGVIWAWVESSKPEQQAAYDVKSAEEMNALLKEMLGREITGEEAQKFNALVTAYGKDQFDAGVKSGSGGGWMDQVKPLAIAAGAMWFLTYIQNQNNKNR